MRTLNPVGSVPVGEHQEEYQTLHVLQYELDDDTPVLASVWQPSQQDLEVLNKGGCVWLGVCVDKENPVHPPVTMAVGGMPRIQE